jgi:hypothetical protein
MNLPAVNAVFPALNLVNLVNVQPMTPVAFKDIGPLLYIPSLDELPESLNVNVQGNRVADGNCCAVYWDDTWSDSKGNAYTCNVFYVVHIPTLTVYKIISMPRPDGPLVHLQLEKCRDQQNERAERARQMIVNPIDGG